MCELTTTLVSYFSSSCSADNDELLYRIETSFTSSGAEKPIIKLLSWKFVLACPPNPSQLYQASSSKSNSIVETLSKRVCLRVDDLTKFGDTNGTIFKAHKDRELIDFRKFERVKATVEAVEHPEERQAQAEIVYADDVSCSHKLFPAFTLLLTPLSKLRSFLVSELSLK